MKRFVIILFMIAFIWTPFVSAKEDTYVINLSRPVLDSIKEKDLNETSDISSVMDLITELSKSGLSIRDVLVALSVGAKVDLDSYDEDVVIDIDSNSTKMFEDMKSFGMDLLGNYSKVVIHFTDEEGSLPKNLDIDFTSLDRLLDSNIVSIPVLYSMLKEEEIHSLMESINHGDTASLNLYDPSSHEAVAKITVANITNSDCEFVHMVTGDQPQAWSSDYTCTKETVFDITLSSFVSHKRLMNYRAIAKYTYDYNERVIDEETDSSYQVFNDVSASDNLLMYIPDPVLNQYGIETTNIKFVNEDSGMTNPNTSNPLLLKIIGILFLVSGIVIINRTLKHA